MPLSSPHRTIRDAFRMKKILVAVALVSATAAFAQDPHAGHADHQATKPAFSTSESTIGSLLDNPKTKAVLDKIVPALATNPQIDMARGFTLKQVQQFAPDQLTDELLAKIDAELATVPAG